MKQIITLFLLAIVVSAYPQTFCSTPNVTNTCNRIINYSINNRNNSNYYHLKLYFHIIRRTNGTGGLQYSDVNAAYSILNDDFSCHNISFIWDGTIDYIDNDTFFADLNAGIFNVNNHNDGIDIYLFPNSVYNQGGMANGIGVSTELYIGGLDWFSPYVPLATSHAISHEMGHILSLWHTHHGTYNEGGTDPGCPELVNGSNSDVCGDYVSDTPADPFLNYNVDCTTFQWLGTGQDINGDYYNPDTRQIMSYTPISCMNHFSLGQGYRMRNAIELLTHLQNCLVPYISGPVIPCDEDIYKVESLRNTDSVSWHWQNNTDVQLLSSGDNCTIGNPNKTFIDDVLIATLYDNSGLPYDTLTKQIHTGMNFSGTYEQAASNTGQIAFNSGEMFIVAKGYNVLLQSNGFIGATITHSGTSNYSLTNYNNGLINVIFNRHFPNDPLLPNGVMSLSSDTITITGKYANNCETFQFKIIGVPIILDNLFAMSVRTSEKSVKITVNIDPSYEKRTTNEMELDEWQLTISNVTTGKKMLIEKNKELSTTVNTERWPSGIYVAKVVYNNVTASEKFVIQN